MSLTGNLVVAPVQFSTATTLSLLAILYVVLGPVLTLAFLAIVRRKTGLVPRGSCALAFWLVACAAVIVVAAVTVDQLRRQQFSVAGSLIAIGGAVAIVWVVALLVWLHNSKVWRPWSLRREP